jgi:mevalonate kinase
LGTGAGFGKVILFNEHFVVYGIPAIASAIGAKTTALVEKRPGSGVEMRDDRPETEGYKAEKLGQQKESLDKMLKFMNIDTEHNAFRITLGGDLVAASGVGASAASCAAIARAFVASAASIVARELLAHFDMTSRYRARVAAVARSSPCLRRQSPSKFPPGTAWRYCNTSRSTTRPESPFTRLAGARRLVL